MRYMICVLILMCALGQAEGQTTAQEDDLPVLRDGSKVRVTAATLSSGRTVGRLSSFSNDTLLIERDSYPQRISIPIASVSKLEIATGSRSYTAVGALVGVGVGGTVGYLIGKREAEKLTDVENCEDFGECFGRALAGPGAAVSALVITGAGIAAGALVGAIVGASIKTDTWDQVSLPNIALVPAGNDGISLSVTIAAPM